MESLGLRDGHIEGWPLKGPEVHITVGAYSHPMPVAALDELIVPC